MKHQNYLKIIKNISVFPITAGHPTRKKEISLKIIAEVANYFSNKNFVPTFFIEEKYKEKINTIKTMVKKLIFSRTSGTFLT